MRIINLVRDWWLCRRQCGLELNARGCPVVVWQCQRPWCRGRHEWAQWLDANPQPPINRPAAPRHLDVS